MKIKRGKKSFAGLLSSWSGKVDGAAAMEGELGKFSAQRRVIFHVIIGIRRSRLSLGSRRYWNESAPGVIYVAPH